MNTTAIYQTSSLDTGGSGYDGTTGTTDSIATTYYSTFGTESSADGNVATTEASGFTKETTSAVDSDITTSIEAHTEAADLTSTAFTALTDELTSSLQENQSTNSMTVSYTSTQGSVPTTTPPLVIGGLTVPEFAGVMAAAGVVLIFIVVALLCCMYRKKKTDKGQPRGKTKDVWIPGSGGGEVEMINMTAMDVKRNSEHSEEENKITAVVVEPSTVNVFSTATEARSPTLSHVSRNSITSNGSRQSVKSESSEVPSMFKRSKTKTSLVKVEGPTITSNKESGGSSNKYKASDDEEDSVFSDSQNTKSMETFGSANTSPQHMASPSKNGSKAPPSKKTEDQKVSTDGNIQPNITSPTLTIPPPPAVPAIPPPPAAPASSAIPPPPAAPASSAIPPPPAVPAIPTPPEVPASPTLPPPPEPPASPTLPPPPQV